MFQDLSNAEFVAVVYVSGALYTLGYIFADARHEMPESSRIIRFLGGATGGLLWPLIVAWKVWDLLTETPKKTPKAPNHPYVKKP